MPKSSNDKMKEKVESLADKVGGEVYRHYSGRGMFGAQCIGIVAPWSVINTLKNPKSLPKPSIDSMGLDGIIYWPSIDDPRNNNEENEE